MAYRHGRRSIRDVYEDHFAPIDGREVTVRRVVNIVDKRSTVPRQELDYGRDFHDDQWYSGPPNFQNEREFRQDGNYPQTHCRFFEENPNFGNFCRNPTPPRHEAQYSQSYYSNDDLRHQLASRKNRRTRPYYRQRGAEAPGSKSTSDRKLKEGYRISAPVTFKRDHSPVKGEAQPSGSSGLNTNSKFSPNRDKVTYQQAQQIKPNLLTSQTPSSSVEASPHSSASSKEKPPASVVASEEVVTASMEPKPTPDEIFKARRSEAIRVKALEIEKDYRKDCETFRTVVKMLVVKEPTLEDLLQAPLHKNLLELKERCLDSLRHFVKELDEVLEQPDSSSTQATGHNVLP